MYDFTKRVTKFKPKYRRKFYWNGHKVSGKVFYQNYEKENGRPYRSFAKINDNLDTDWIIMDKLSIEITNEIDQEIIQKLKSLVKE